MGFLCIDNTQYFIVLVSQVCSAFQNGFQISHIERPSGRAIPCVGIGTWQTFDVGTSALERTPLKEVLRKFIEESASVEPPKKFKLLGDKF